MDLDDLRRIIQRSTDAFRLETLPQYLVPQEETDFAAWRRGDRVRAHPDRDAWLGEMRDVISAGRRFWRVRILDYPLVEYSEFELFGYQDTAAVGQEVFVANRAWNTDLADLHEDFWLYDSATAVSMVYDDEGHFLYPELRENVRPYLEIRDRAVRHAVTLTDYLRKYEPDLIADPV
ncbi:DUF6879 family protein [Pseudonocardia spinosispora]|uniref:DUF6879 family protein n=1 Tax=Pseudonocardia spinosispora TaxID=103441 RepID=UPI0012EB2FD9|nr:DUF6879 family protein [Pseudonocardia spinosispora]